jgi:nitrogen fixation/metabolism regulation signal transduction histidine kinase
VLIERLRVVVSFELTGSVPARGASFDTAQLEQALINLLKNARESGADPESIELAVNPSAQGFSIQVRDRGGFSGAALENACRSIPRRKRHRTRTHAVPRNRRSARRTPAYREPPRRRHRPLWLPDGS